MMNTQNIRGYKPHVVRELLGLGKETLRYWKAKLDPKPSRAYFSAADLLAYRILQACIQDVRIHPRELQEFDISIIFHFCYGYNYKEADDYLLQINIENKSLSISKEISNEDFRNRKLYFLYLKEIVDEHLASFMSLGNAHSLH